MLVSRLLVLFLAPFSCVYVEMIINYIQSKKTREYLNGDRKTLFSYTSLWSYLTYILVVAGSLGAFELSRLIITLVFKDFSLFSLAFVVSLLIYTIISGISTILFEVIIGWFYTLIKARHWDYRQTAILRSNVLVANFFCGQTDIPHMIVYFSVQPAIFLVWYFIR